MPASWNQITIGFSKSTGFVEQITLWLQRIDELRCVA